MLGDIEIDYYYAKPMEAQHTSIAHGGPKYFNSSCSTS